MFNDKVKQDWAEMDIRTVKRAVTEFSNKVSIAEFEKEMCSWCPYNCETSVFCWSRFLEDRKMYVEIMEKLLRAFYTCTSISTFNYFRTTICNTCGDACKYVYSSHPCAKDYLDQFGKSRPLGVYGPQDAVGYSKKEDTTKKIKVLKTIPYKESKIKIIPMLTVSGTKITKFINKTWLDKEKEGNVVYENTSKKWNNNS